MDRWFGGVEGQGWYAPDPGERGHQPSGEDIHLNGTKVGFFWDYGVTVPLWDEEGLLPDDPDWLERELSLSRGLIADLVTWAALQDRTGSPPDPDTHRAEEERLFLRLREELGPGIEVVRHW